MDSSVSSEHRFGRRALLTGAAALATTLAMPAIISRPALAAAAAPRTIRLHNLHTGETLKTTYWAEGGYIREALDEVNVILRDFRTGDVHPIDPGLLDLLQALRTNLETSSAFDVISGYRSPRTNAMLSGKSGGVAKKSLHMQGMAIDIALPGRELRVLHRAAKSLKGGGVGYYPKSGFVHMDVGRVRYW